MKKEPHNNQITALAILCVTAIALAFMTLTTVANAQTDKPAQIALGMGCSVLGDITGVNLEGSGIAEGKRHGMYLGMESGNRANGVDDFITIYGGKAFRLGNRGQFRLGAALGAAQYGNTVTNLQAYGMGRLVGNDGADYFIAGVEGGFLFPITEHGALSTMYSHTLEGPIYRLTYNLQF